MITSVAKVEVTLADGSTKETVELRRLSPRQLYQLFELLNGGKTSADAIALCTGKPIEWTDTLSDESFGELAKRVHEENFQRAVLIVEKGDVGMAIVIAKPNGTASSIGVPGSGSR